MLKVQLSSDNLIWLLISHIGTTMTEDPFALFQQFFSKQNELMSKQLEPFIKQVNDSWAKFSNMLDVANKDLSERTIETKASDEIKYTTHFKVDGDILNEFPSKVPPANDLYWTRHSQLVDRVLAERQAIIEKSIETVGTTIKGLVNPISFSPIDMIKLIDLFKK
jgi:hypothetical protein